MELDGEARADSRGRLDLTLFLSLFVLYLVFCNCSSISFLFDILSHPLVVRTAFSLPGTAPRGKSLLKEHGQWQWNVSRKGESG